MTTEQEKKLLDDVKALGEFKVQFQPMLEAIQALVDLIPDITGMIEYQKERKIQQLSLPVDDASKAALGAAFGVGAGSTSLTQTASASGGSVTIGKIPVGSIIVNIDGKLYEIGYISAP